MRALGLDVGSTHVKAAVVELEGADVRELSVAARPAARRDALGLVSGALDAARAALVDAGVVVEVVGIASMAETGALVDPDGGARGPLLRWDRAADADDRLALAHGLDPVALHAATGVPLTAKLPLLTWAALVRDRLPAGARWAFAADLVGAVLTGVVATDHTLAGRSGALRLPAAGAPLDTTWDADLLAVAGVPRALPPRILSPGEPLGTVRRGMLPGVAGGAVVHLAGHDHAVVARLAGMRAPGIAVHSLGTTEAVLALADPARPVDRALAGREGVSVVRGVDGELEGVLAGSPAAGRLVADWRSRARAAGADVDALLDGAAPARPELLALPYPLGRQCPSPDPEARLELLGDPGDPAEELAALLRGMAAHGAGMRALVSRLCGASPLVVAAGTPVRGNPRLAGLMAALAADALPVVDLAAPAASGAAALAAERAGLAAPVVPPFRRIEPDDDGAPDLARRFADALTDRTTPGGHR